MTLKLWFLLPAMLFAYVTRSQTGTFDKINVRSSLKLQDKTITEISIDPLLTSESDSKIPTEKAVKKYIDNNTALIKKAGGGILKQNDSIYLGGLYDVLYLSNDQDGYGNFFISDHDGWQMGYHRPEGNVGNLLMNNLGNLQLDVYDSYNHAAYLFSKDSFCIQDNNSSLGNQQQVAFYRDGRVKLGNFKNTGSGLNFLSTDLNGYLKLKQLKIGNGISSIGDSVYLGGFFKNIHLEATDESAILDFGDSYFQVSTTYNENYSVLSLGNGSLQWNGGFGGRRNQLLIYENQFIYNDGISDKFKVDNTGTTNISFLNVLNGLNFGIYHTSQFGAADFRDGGCVFVLDDLTENKTLFLPDPAAQPGRLYYVFNANNTEAYHYTTNYPIYKSGTVSYTTIPGNIEFRVMIISDGEKWLQLN